MSYSLEKVDKAIVSLDAALVLDIKKHQTMIELKYSLSRISRALKPTFWLTDALKEEIKVQQHIVDKKTPKKWGNAVARAKKIILDEEQIFWKDPPWRHEFMPWQQWDEFKFHMKKQWEKDRENKIWLKK